MAKDEQWIEAVCEQVYGPLVRAMTLYSGHREIGEDAAHDALVKLVVELRNGVNLTNPAGWAYRVATNRVHRHNRRIGIRKRLDPVPLPDSQLEIEDVMVLRRALAALPKRQRAAVVARYELGLSVRETAASLRCSEGTVRALTHQGATALRADPNLRLEQS